MLTRLQYHDQVLVPRFGWRPPDPDKPVVGAREVDDLLVFNIAYDTSIASTERHRINRWGCYLFLYYTGARAAELVESEKKEPDNAKKLFHQKAVTLPDDGAEDEAPAPDAFSKRVSELLEQEPAQRGRSKSLCYEDILLMIALHPVSGRYLPAMAIRFTHHKGADNRPKPWVSSLLLELYGLELTLRARTVFWLRAAKILVFCPINIIISIALDDKAFDSEHLTDASRVFNLGTWGATKCTPIRWKRSMLKVPVFRMRYHTLRDDLKQQTLEMGHERHWTTKYFRRGTANGATNGKLLFCSQPRL